MFTKDHPAPCQNAAPDCFSFDPSIIPFSRRGSYLFVRKNAFRPVLELSRTQKKYVLEGETRCPVWAEIQPLQNEKEGDLQCSANCARLCASGDTGEIELFFDRESILRVKGGKNGFAICASFPVPEDAFQRPDGSCQFCYDPLGTLLFVPLQGSIRFSKTDASNEKGSSIARIEVVPMAEESCEIAIHYSTGISIPEGPYHSLSECLNETLEDYNRWFAMYPPVPKEYEELKKIAVYAVWTCFTAPSGVLKEPLIFFSKDYSALSWHSVYHAYAMSENVDMSVQTMLSAFCYQDEYGQLPDLLDDQYINMLATKPPIHGFILLDLIKQWGQHFTERHCAMLYLPLKKLYGWWMNMRDSDKDGIPQYNQGCESGMDFTSMLKKGTPVECPDLITYMALLSECLSVIAIKLELFEEANQWRQESERLIHTLVTDFWDGKQFIARLSTTHEPVVFDEAERFIPILLGKRLPADIIKRITEDLSDPRQYYTDYGFRTASMAKNGGHGGVIMDFTQIRIIPGLLESGMRNLGMKELEGYCRLNLEKGPRFGYMESISDYSDADDIFEKVEFSNKYNALSCSVFLAMASMLFREKKQEKREKENGNEF